MKFYAASALIDVEAASYSLSAGLFHPDNLVIYLQALRSYVPPHGAVFQACLLSLIEVRTTC